MPRAPSVVGLDIGTTKIAAVAAHRGGRGLTCAGVGLAAAQGLRRGVVIEMERAVESIAAALEGVEKAAGVRVEEVVIGVAGEHIQGHNCRGAIAIARGGGEVTAREVTRVLGAAQTPLGAGARDILQIEPQEFILDDQHGIRDPIGMTGARLEADVHIVTGASQASQNLVRSVQKAGVDVVGVVHGPLAVARAVLSADERELGAGVVDIGGDLTMGALFTAGSVRHTFILPLGSDAVTHDIAIGCRIPIAVAQEIKERYGAIRPPEGSEDEPLPLPRPPQASERPLTRKFLAAIIRSRMEELFEMIAAEIRKVEGCGDLSAGLVLAGGGSLLPGACELAERVLRLPVRPGIAQEVAGLPAEWEGARLAAGLGLVLHSVDGRGIGRGVVGNGGRLWHRAGERMRGWFSDFF